MAKRLTRRVAAGIIGPELSETLTINPQQGIFNGRKTRVMFRRVEIVTRIALSQPCLRSYF
jgi:hypothetical protein